MDNLKGTKCHINNQSPFWFCQKMEKVLSPRVLLRSQSKQNGKIYLIFFRTCIFSQFSAAFLFFLMNVIFALMALRTL